MSELQFESEKTISVSNLTWKIADFFSVTDQPDFLIESPSFSVGGASWCLQLYQNKVFYDWRKEYFCNLKAAKGKRSSVKRLLSSNIDLRIVRLKSLIKKHSVCFKFQIKNEDILYNYDRYGKDSYDEDSRYSYEGKIDIGEEGNSVELKSSFIDNYKTEKIHRGNFFNLSCELRIERNQVIRKFHDMPSQTDEFELVGGFEKLSQDLKQLVLSETDSDVIIRVKGQEFPAHRAIIGVRSPVFAAMLKSDMKEKASGVVDIDDLDPDVFPDFLCFLYTGNVKELSPKNVIGLYIAADKYNVGELKSSCVQFMKSCLSVDTFCDVITISLRHDEKELLSDAINYFSNNLKEIIQTVQWQKFLTENSIQGNELLIKALSSWQKI